MNKSLLETWYNPLEQFINTEYMKKLFTFLNKEYNNKIVYPNKNKVFRVFQKTNYNEVRVIILGQDPYPDGSGTGVAFANEDNIRESSFSPSLIKIKDCIERTNKDGLYIDFDPTLEKWIKQGVLLLNSSLTVVKNKPGSHTIYWKNFIKEIIKILNNNKTGLIFCLWGNQAKQFKQFINSSNHYILECSHPASACYNNVDWDCNHFNKINQIITEQNGEEFKINW